VARQLGIGEQTLCNWVELADIAAGYRPGVTTEDKQRIAELENENRELRRANAICFCSADNCPCCPCISCLL
jgi:transposase